MAAQVTEQERAESTGLAIAAALREKRCVALPSIIPIGSFNLSP